MILKKKRTRLIKKGDIIVRSELDRALTDLKKKQKALRSRWNSNTIVKKFRETNFYIGYS